MTAEKREGLTGEWLGNLESSRVAVLEGNNFSGRTELLRELTGLVNQGQARPQAWAAVPRLAYVGPELYNSISGLAPTVRHELQLHLVEELKYSPLAEVIDSLGISPLFGRNPFTLSGGEQACLAITCALSIKPFILAIDCALEQIAPSLKMKLLDYLGDDRFSKTSTLIADNRLREWAKSDSRTKLSVNNQRFPKRRLRFDPIDSSVDLGIQHFSPYCLRLDSLSFRYPQGPTVLRNVAADLEPGTLYFLEGRNGAGKSTLAKLLCGALRPDSGLILANGNQSHPWKQPGQVVGYHFQNPDLQLFSTSVEQEVKAGPVALGLRGQECVARCRSVMAAFGISHISSEHPLDLPFVIRKRVALAATVAMGRPWLILDEPMLGQDNASAEAIARIITQLVDSGTGVIAISHSTWLHQRFPAKIIRLEDGLLSQ